MVVTSGMEYRRSWFYVQRNGKRIATFWIDDIGDEGDARLNAVLFVMALKAEEKRSSKAEARRRKREGGR